MGVVLIVGRGEGQRVGVAPAVAAAGHQDPGGGDGEEDPADPEDDLTTIHLGEHVRRTRDVRSVALRPLRPPRSGERIRGVRQAASALTCGGLRAIRPALSHPGVSPDVRSHSHRREAVPRRRGRRRSASRRSPARSAPRSRSPRCSGWAGRSPRRPGRPTVEGAKVVGKILAQDSYRRVLHFRKEKEGWTRRRDTASPTPR